MEEVSLLIQNTYSLLHNTTTDKHGVPPTKRLFNVAMLDSSIILLGSDMRNVWEDPELLQFVPYGKTWVTVNGPLQRVLSLPEKIFNLELKRRTRSPTLKTRFLILESWILFVFSL
ncbi:hypothetical protein Tco_0514385 [Tanacetum coccineum]